MEAIKKAIEDKHKAISYSQKVKMLLHNSLILYIKCISHFLQTPVVFSL